MNQQQRKDTRTAILALAVKIRDCYEDEDGNGIDQDEANDLAKLALAFCEDEEKAFHVTCYPFGPEGQTLGRRHDSGPFASRAEAERACREALSTGRFYRVAIEERQP